MTGLGGDRVWAEAQIIYRRLYRCLSKCFKKLPPEALLYAGYIGTLDDLW